MSTFRLEHAVPHTLARPLVIAIALMLATPTFAADFTITAADGTETTPQTLTGTAGSNTGVVETGGTLTVGAGLDAITATGPDNTITNSGSITGGSEGIASAGDDVTITNNGTITSTTNDGIYSSGADATITNSGTTNGGEDGIQSVGGGSTIINSGFIFSTLDNGIESNGTGNTITNSGTIDAADDGIFSNGSNAIITNSGSITGANDGIDSDGANAIITNSGTITGTSFDGITSAGDDVTITNNGIINAGYGIYSMGAKATITNSGIINGDYGIYSDGDDATITNSGSITADGANSDGIFSNGNNATITNSGTINAGNRGIYSSRADATITNSGTINGAFGIFSFGTNTTINNSGHITGTNHAILGGISDSLTLNLLKGSQLMGAIDLDGAGDNDTVNVHGGSVSATLTLLNTENINLLGPGLKLSGDVVVSVDGTADAARSVVLSTITSDIHDQIAQRTYLPAAPQPVKAVTSTVLPGLQFKQHKPVAWMQVLGGDSDRDAEDNARAYEHDYVGINGGYEWDLGQRRVGLVGGVVNSDTDGNENSFKSDTEHFYLGAYTSQQLQGFTLTTSLLGGYGRHDNERLVIDNLNGREVAKSDFSSLFISPSVTIASAYKIYERVELRPSASVNYSIAWLDDHSERGTTQSNLSVDDRKIQALSTKLQIAAAYAYSATSEFELRTGVNSRYTDDDDTEISIGGSKSKFSNVGDENVYSSFVGARVRIIGSDQLSLVADVELGGNGDEDYKAGHLSVEYTFH